MTILKEKKKRPNDISSHIQLIYKQNKSAPFHFCNETNRVTFLRNSSPIDFNIKKNIVRDFYKSNTLKGVIRQDKHLKVYFAIHRSQVLINYL